MYGGTVLCIYSHSHICMHNCKYVSFFGSLGIVLYVLTHRHLFTEIFKIESMLKLERTFMCVMYVI